MDGDGDSAIHNDNHNRSATAPQTATGIAHRVKAKSGYAAAAVDGEVGVEGAAERAVRAGLAEPDAVQRHLVLEAQHLDRLHLREPVSENRYFRQIFFALREIFPEIFFHTRTSFTGVVRLTVIGCLVDW